MNKKQVAISLLKSWQIVDKGINNFSDLKNWILKLNKDTHIIIDETNINEDSFWFFDKNTGCIKNRNESFFQVTGLQYYVDKELIEEQPVIIQDEIGFLGIIAKEINGILYFLMQAKIEPGNINGVQISPTIQATRSNFTRMHGGNTPLYLEWFKNIGSNTELLYDQIQSEQGTRFIGKRNRNIIILIKEDIDILPNFKWMTLGQIKELMKEDNLVNMDTRTVLSGLFTIFNRFDGSEFEQYFGDKSLFKSFFAKDSYYSTISKLNDYKMYHDVTKKFIALDKLSDWEINNSGVFCKKPADFEVKYYDVEIEGREVRKWLQPLFKAKNKALFVLFTRIKNNEREFLIKLCPEIGCFDKVEFGPSLQIANYIEYTNSNDELYKLFIQHVESQKGILIDVYLSEEGGRFYHEENRNLIIEIDTRELSDLNNDYMWVNYATLNKLVESNNVLNIQLRNLMSLIPLNRTEDLL